MPPGYEHSPRVTEDPTHVDSAKGKQRRFRNIVAMATVTLAVGGVAIGCGGSDVEEGVNQGQSTAEKGLDSATGSAGETVTIPADPTKLAFGTTTANADAGTVTLRMENPSAIPHNIALQDPDTKGEVVGKGGVSEVTVELPAGTYTYYCSVPGHLEAGMKGTLVVK